MIDKPDINSANIHMLAMILSDIIECLAKHDIAVYPNTGKGVAMFGKVDPREAAKLSVLDNIIYADTRRRLDVDEAVDE